MRVGISIEVDHKLPEKAQVQRFLRQAVNRASAGARTEIVRAVRGKVPSLRSRVVRQAISITPGSSAPTAIVRVSEQPLSLSKVMRRARATRAVGGRPGGLVGVVGRGVLEIPGGFVGPGGHYYVRRGPQRLPLRRLSAPSVRDLAVSTWDETAPLVQRRLRVEIDRAMERALKRR